MSTTAWCRLARSMCDDSRRPAVEIRTIIGSIPTDSTGATGSYRRPLLREDLQERATAALANLLSKRPVLSDS